MVYRQGEKTKNILIVMWKCYCKACVTFRNFNEDLTNFHRIFKSIFGVIFFIYTEIACILAPVYCNESLILHIYNKDCVKINGVIEETINLFLSTF